MRPILRGNTRNPDLATLRSLAAPLGVSFESLCRAAVGLDPDGEEKREATNVVRQEISELLEEMEPRKRESVLRFLRDVL